MKDHTVSFLKLFVGVGLGYALSHHFSHPTGRARKHVPLAKIGNVQLTPNLLIATKDKKWHIHHWAYVPAGYLPFVALFHPLLKKHFVHGFILGTVIHGLTFGDRFTFTFNEN